MPTSFSYQVKGSMGDRAINLRLDPYEVNWTYKLNTSVQNTLGGQVIQILSCQIDTLTVIGKFGKEGPGGSVVIDDNGQRKRKSRPVTESYDYANAPAPYGIGLTQMTEFFREYFALASQGGDPDVTGSYVQVPMRFSYSNRSFAAIIPTEFPSYKRSNQDFAPDWRVVASVIEAPEDLTKGIMTEALRRLEDVIGFRRKNPWSDPLAGQSEQAIPLEEIASQFKSLLPKFTKGDIEDMIWRDISLPNMTGVYSNIVQPIPDTQPQGDTQGGATKPSGVGGTASASGGTPAIDRIQ